MIKRIFFVLAAVGLIAAGFYFRTQNVKQAQDRQDKLVAQDLSGADTKAEVAALKSFVNSNMGASAEFTLTGAYDRALVAAQASAAAQQASGQVYADAQKACAGKTDSITQAKCNQDYIQKHLASVPNPTPIADPKIADYEYKFHAPFWTPDLAGASFLGALIALGFVVYGVVRRKR